MNVICFLSVDQSLGKIDKHSLSQETLMELFIESFTNREAICGSKENPADLSQWEKVYFNDTNEIVEFDWFDMYLEGSIELKWLPSAFKHAIISWNMLKGTVDLTCLPDKLVTLSLGRNAFEGLIDVTSLPCSLEKLFLRENRFYGHTDFSQLPESLDYFNISNTELEGEIRHRIRILNVQNSRVVDKRP